MPLNSRASSASSPPPGSSAMRWLRCPRPSARAVHQPLHRPGHHASHQPERHRGDRRQQGDGVQQEPPPDPRLGRLDRGHRLGHLEGAGCPPVRAVHRPQHGVHPLVVDLPLEADRFLAREHPGQHLQRRRAGRARRVRHDRPRAGRVVEQDGVDRRCLGHFRQQRLQVLPLHVAQGAVEGQAQRGGVGLHLPPGLRGHRVLPLQQRPARVDHHDHRGDGEQGQQQTGSESHQGSPAAPLQDNARPAGPGRRPRPRAILRRPFPEAPWAWPSSPA
jgi:hypothetical protein